MQGRLRYRVPFSLSVQKLLVDFSFRISENVHSPDLRDLSKAQKKNYTRSMDFFPNLIKAVQYAHCRIIIK